MGVVPLDIMLAFRSAGAIVSTVNEFDADDSVRFPLLQKTCQLWLPSGNETGEGTENAPAVPVIPVCTAELFIERLQAVPL